MEESVSVLLPLRPVAAVLVRSKRAGQKKAFHETGTFRLNIVMHGRLSRHQ
jgi:hypothetical protein